MIVNGLPRFETCHDERLKIVFNWNDAEKRTVLFCLATCAHDGIVSGRCPIFSDGNRARIDFFGSQIRESLRRKQGLNESRLVTGTIWLTSLREWRF
jgi:hypothetical protein